MPAISASTRGEGMRRLAVGLAATCLLVGCGGAAAQHSKRTSTTRPASPPAPSSPPRNARLVAGTTSAAPAPASQGTAGVITRLLTAAFVHPEPAQCMRAMTPRYVSQAFSADAARSELSPMAECRAHQRLRAKLPVAERRVTVDDIVMSGAGVHATVRGANGYPIGVELTRRGDAWLLDGFGVAAVAGGHGREVAPTGSLYAYRIPPGFVSGDTAIGPVQTTGAAFSTAVILPGGRSDEGIAVAQTAFGFGAHDRLALGAAVRRLDRAIRESSLARVIGRPVAGKVGGRFAVSWDLGGVRIEPANSDGETVFVFSSAKNVVVVNCRWPHAGPDRSALRTGCKALLATLSVG